MVSSLEQSLSGPVQLLIHFLYHVIWTPSQISGSFLILDLRIYALYNIYTSPVVILCS